MKWRRRSRPAARPNVPKRGRGDTRRHAVAAVGRFARRAFWIAVIGGMVWGGFAVYRTMAPRVHDWTELQTIDVLGHQHVTREEVVAQLQLPPSPSILALSTSRLAERLRTHPWIKSADVSRMPPHALMVRIVERRPAAVLRAATGGWLLDDEGAVLAAVNETDLPELPVLRGIDVEALRDGSLMTRRTVQAGLRVAALLGRSFDGRAEVDIQDRDNPVGYINGLRFQFGPTAFEEKWDRYRKLEPHLAAAPSAKAATWNEVDLRYPGKVIVRERG